MKILFLEDDPIIAEIVVEKLQEDSYDVDYAFNIQEVNQYLLDTEKYDLYILDVNVPDGTGFEFLSQRRKFGDRTPTIFITALNSISDMKIGFQSGCDDYLKKPFELDELELRIDNIKRHYGLIDHVKIDTNIYLDKINMTIIINDKTQHIREKEALVLEYLSRNHNRAVSNDELSSNIWEYDDMPSNSTIRTYIKNIRHIIGTTRIETIKGIGYRFI